MAEIQIGGVSLASESGGTVTLNSSVDIKGNLNATGSAPIYACRAWVNFNGTGTVAIRGSGNVSSITDNGTGDYTVNFTTAMPDANYATTGLAKEFDATTNTTVNLYYAKQTIANTIASGSIRVNTLAGTNGTAADSEVVSVAIFR